MIKAKLQDGSLVLGLSEENIKRLKAGQPIAFNLKEMGCEDRRLMIFFGETEEAMYEAMMPYIGKDTKLK